MKLKKLKPLINFLARNSKVEVSWADLSAVNWQSSPNPMGDLIQSLSVKTRPVLNDKIPTKSIDQRLSLA